MGETIEQSEEQRICPYFEVECTGNCPGWLPEVEDCLFHVCLTEVKDTFVKAARYIDKHVGAADGFGMNTLTSLRDLMQGTATKDQKEVVRGVLVSIIQTAIIPKIASLKAVDLAALVGKVESKISFEFGKLFGTEDPEGPEIN